MWHFDRPKTDKKESLLFPEDVVDAMKRIDPQQSLNFFYKVTTRDNVFVTVWLPSSSWPNTCLCSPAAITDEFRR